MNLCLDSTHAPGKITGRREASAICSTDEKPRVSIPMPSITEAEPMLTHPGTWVTLLADGRYNAGQTPNDALQEFQRALG